MDNQEVEKIKPKICELFGEKTKMDGVEIQDNIFEVTTLCIRVKTLEKELNDLIKRIEYVRGRYSDRRTGGMHFVLILLTICMIIWLVPK